nr:IS66 family transposase [uncultured Methanospirillum sp.]
MEIPEEIKSKFSECPPEIVAYIYYLHEKIDKLEARVTELESRLNLNSTNSGKPPSSDGYTRKNRATSLRKKTQKQPGGQPGHKGKTLEQSPNPDHIETHSPDICSCCGRSLQGGTIISIEKRQVFDLPPPPAIEITEHRSQTLVCNHCGCKTSGFFPPDVTQPVQYGSRIKAYMSYLVHYQFIPYEREVEACYGLFGVSISPGTVVNLTHNLSEKLTHFKDTVTNTLKLEPIIHNDETGVRVEGKLHWLHVTCTSHWTHYFIQKKRGTEGINEIGILPDFKGISVHDFWKPYLSYPCTHSFCGAHILRELKRVEEETKQEWSGKLIELLIQAKEIKEEYHLDGVPIPPVMMNSLNTSYDELIQIGLDENPPPIQILGKKGRTKKTFTRNLLERFELYNDGVLRFIQNKIVPFDSNLAERDIRMMKVKIKISREFRDKSTAKAVILIRSYISIIRKNGIRVIEAIASAFKNNPWIPEKDKMKHMRKAEC